MSDLCKCSFSIRMTGDGCRYCRYCQPQTYIDSLHDIIEEDRKELDALQPKLVEIDVKDIRIDSYDPNGSNGFGTHVSNGIRLMHVPTGIVAECHSERSQHRNKSRAWEELQSKVRLSDFNKNEYQEVLSLKAELQEAKSRLYDLLLEEDGYAAKEARKWLRNNDPELFSRLTKTSIDSK